MTILKSGDGKTEMFVAKDVAGAVKYATKAIPQEGLRATTEEQLTGSVLVIEGKRHRELALFVICVQKISQPLREHVEKVERERGF